MNVRRQGRLAVGLASLSLSVLLAGCTAQVRGPSEPSPTASVSLADSLEQTCASASAALSDVQSADSGYGHGDLDAAGWAELVADGKAKMSALAGEENPGAEAEIADLARGFEAIPDAAGAPEDYLSISATGDISVELNKVCTANGTEIVISMKFGG